VLTSLANLQYFTLAYFTPGAPMSIFTKHPRLNARLLMHAVIVALALCVPSGGAWAQSTLYICAKGDSIVIRPRCRSGETKVNSLAALSKKVESTTLASGKTITGIFQAFVSAAVADDPVFAPVSFPFKAPVNVSDADIIVKTDANSDNECQGDRCADPIHDSTSNLCRGSSAAPTAPKGKVCIYLDYSQNVKARTVSGVMVGGRDPATGNHLSRQGFLVYGSVGPLGTAFNMSGTWAYTAP